MSYWNTNVSFHIDLLATVYLQFDEDRCYRRSLKKIIRTALRIICKTRNGSRVMMIVRYLIQESWHLYKHHFLFYFFSLILSLFVSYNMRNLFNSCGISIRASWFDYFMILISSKINFLSSSKAILSSFSKLKSDYPENSSSSEGSRISEK